VYLYRMDVILIYLWHASNAASKHHSLWLSSITAETTLTDCLGP